MSASGEHGRVLVLTSFHLRGPRPRSLSLSSERAKRSPASQLPPRWWKCARNSLSGEASTAKRPTRSFLNTSLPLDGIIVVRPPWHVGERGRTSTTPTHGDVARKNPEFPPPALRTVSSVGVETSRRWKTLFTQTPPPAKWVQCGNFERSVRYGSGARDRLVTPSGSTALQIDHYEFSQIWWVTSTPKRPAWSKWKYPCASVESLTRNTNVILENSTHMVPNHEKTQIWTLDWALWPLCYSSLQI